MIEVVDEVVAEFMGERHERDAAAEADCTMFGARGTSGGFGSADHHQTVWDPSPWRLTSTGEGRPPCVELQPRHRDRHGGAHGGDCRSGVVLMDEQVVEFPQSRVVG